MKRKLKRFAHIKGGVKGAEKILRKYLEKKDIKVNQWQIIPRNIWNNNPRSIDVDYVVDLFIDYTKL